MMSAPAITISETTDMKTKIADPDIADPRKKLRPRK
jgi:hypothetical protein